MDRDTSNKIVQEKWNAMEVTESKRKNYKPEATSQDSKEKNQNFEHAPSLEEIRKKFLSQDQPSTQPSVHPIGSTYNPLGSSYNENENDIEVRLMRPKSSAASDDFPDNKERTVIISKTKGLTGTQG